MKIDIPPDIEDEIVVKSLKWARETLLSQGTRVFDGNRKKDLKAIKEHVKALDLIIKYYSVG